MMILMIENWLIGIIKWIFVQSPGNWRAAVQAVNDDMNPPKLQRGQAAVSSDRRHGAAAFGEDARTGHGVR
ncbi:hypothetical protein RHMOL_Rhmol07G0314700 [Rhododendron molle]|uniref:Uncharacterized protein n=1 Tax=Rhododendron molle TaxID=49168 RepID=A0ACC0N6T3_RHOML|nr:hypothetical protein RHMOL_Rhmol07G0314700 [Rhododendron molle]